MKNIFTESLESKLIKYSLAAGAVLISTKSANATVTSYTVDTTLTNTDSLAISFNGIQKFKIFHNVTFGSAPSYIASIQAGSGSAKWIYYKGNNTYTNANYPYVRPLTYSFSIKSGKKFANNGNNNEPFVNTSNGTNTNTGKSFLNSTKYIGVQFKLTDGLHYGWIKIQMIRPDNVKIISYAYETTVGLAIKAGSVTSLPVELTTFMANTESDKVELQWKTATEVNNYGFEIQRAPVISNEVRNLTWTKVGFVKGSGTSNSPQNYSFVDDNPLSGKAEYRLKQIDNDGQFVYSKTVEVTLLPAQFSLGQNYPNPFNPTTTIQYAIPKAENVTLKVYDELGREVASLVDEKKAAGQYNVQFNGSDLASGIYFYRITAGNFTGVKKLMLLK